MKRTLYLVTAALLAVAATAQAADLSKEGSFDFTACWSGRSNLVAISKTQWANAFEMTGSTRSNPPGGMSDMISFRCVGTITSYDNQQRQLTACEGIDRDGHKRLTHFETGPDGKVARRLVAGTGKYEGMSETSGGIEQLGPFPTIKPGTFQNCNRQTGTYKLK